MIFNKAMPLEAAHMLVAAYVVGGFLIASVYAMGMLRGRRDRYHRLGFIIPFTVAAIAIADPDGGRRLAGPLGLQQRAGEVRGDRAGARRPSSDVPETLFGHLNSNGTVSGGIPIPGLASSCPIRATGTNTVVQGLEPVPGRATQPDRSREVNVVHLAWDVMVGLGTLLFLLSVWYGRRWLFRRDMPEDASGSCASPPCAGVLSVITMEAGWVVTEVGRQPWIVHNYMKVEDAATGNTGVWITFLARRRALRRRSASRRSSCCAA